MTVLFKAYRTACASMLALLAAGSFPGHVMAQGSPDVEYQSLSILHVKPERLTPFLAAIKANATSAHSEAGNLAFVVFQATDHPDTLYVLEQWRNASSYAAHLKRPALLAMHKEAANDLIGTIGHTRLKAVGPGDGHQPESSAEAKSNSDVLVFLEVKPDSLEQFQQDVRNVTPTFRAAPGNVAFDVFQDQQHPLQMVQLERWSSDATHQANLKRPIITTIRADYAKTLAKPMFSGRVVVNDLGF